MNRIHVSVLLAAILFGCSSSSEPESDAGVALDSATEDSQDATSDAVDEELDAPAETACLAAGKETADCSACCSLTCAGFNGPMRCVESL